MKKIDQIWTELESESSPESGILYKRLSGEVLPSVYIAMKYPEKLRCIAAHLDLGSVSNTFNISNLKDIRIEKMIDKKNPEKCFFLIILANNQHKDVFSTLSEDLINRVSSITAEKELIKQLINRLEKWRLLFEKIGQQGLSDEAQIGLYGELLFLKKFLHNNENKLFCIDTWKGPQRAVQDFQYSHWAVEVKTSHSKNQQKIHISSERQLDTSIIPAIFLYHFSIDVRDGYGESLNSIVNQLNNFLTSDTAALNSFNIKLLEYGYFYFQAHLYERTGYSIRKESVFLVKDDFPRITEDIIPPGVGDVRYSIILPDDPQWIVGESDLFNILN